MVDKDEELKEDESAAAKDEPESESSASDSASDSEASDSDSDSASEATTEPLATRSPDADARGEEDDDAGEDAATPIQLGYRRYVYAAYMAGAIAIAFLCTKFIDYGWFKAAQLKPDWFATIGSEPTDEITVPLSAAIGVSVAVYYWRQKKTRTLIEEIAEELTRVTWPTRTEVTNSTTTVIIATAFATIFFALMDQFWLWVTKHVYGS